MYVGASIRQHSITFSSTFLFGLLGKGFFFKSVGADRHCGSRGVQCVSFSAWRRRPCWRNIGFFFFLVWLVGGEKKKPSQKKCERGLTLEGRTGRH